MSYKSKYRGQEIEDLLDKIDGFGELSEYLSKREAVQMYQPKGDYLTEHQDISGKVDKVDGKGLSTEDFTSALKSKLESLENFDSSAIEKSISSITQQIEDKVDSSSLAEVATSGDYNDLLNKPAIPSLDGYATESYVQQQIGSINEVLTLIING